jgi:phosphoribosyl-ATP pyrophosphohydrolase
MSGTSDGGDMAVLARLFATIEQRKDADPESSYTAKLVQSGRARIAQKLGEEAVETAIASINTDHGDNTGLAKESADLLYHLLVLWAACGLQPEQVWAELGKREGTSGIAEKASRKD